MSEAYMKQWNEKARVQIDERIERHRKGEVVLKLVDKAGKPVKGASLAVHQTTHEFLFGCNLFVLGQLPTQELNTKYENAFTHLFNFATLPFYWGDFEPNEGQPRFKEGSEYIWRRPPPDELVKWCESHDIVAKGHALMYNRNVFMPDWTERNNPDIFLKQAKKHIKEIANHYKDNIAIWDVVNEERVRRLKPESGHKVPDDYLTWCFRETAPLFPENVELLYNDDTQNHDNPDEYAGYISDIKENGIRIDGMGVQFHLFSLEARDKYLQGNLYPINQLMTFYNRMLKFDLPLNITEITIPGGGDDGAIIQAKIVEDLYKLWFSIPNMSGITWWNLGDGTAHGKENKTMAGLLDQEMNPKPAYEVLDRLINHEWKTNEDLRTNAKGQVQFRGYYGVYKVKVIYQGKTLEKEINISKSGKNHFTINL
ncbi:endo-1,4-beta-xylanase [Aurantibacter sp.]|uniref:endo-1,4-beta-xylanase n=1 Tax=Aurantibacter sp. TaxID=2807103 RepID=UPI003266656A